VRVSPLRSVLATLSVLGVFHAACAPRSREQASFSAPQCRDLDLLVINNTDSSVRIYHVMKLVDEVHPKATKTLAIRPSREVRYRAVLVRPADGSTSRIGGQAIDPATRPTSGEIVIRPSHPDYAGPICQRTMTFGSNLE
jgi:hypothetical protein